MSILLADKQRSAWDPRRSGDACTPPCSAAAVSAGRHAGVDPSCELLHTYQETGGRISSACFPAALARSHEPTTARHRGGFPQPQKKALTLSCAILSSVKNVNQLHVSFCCPLWWEDWRQKKAEFLWMCYEEAGKNNASHKFIFFQLFGY